MWYHYKWWLYIIDTQIKHIFYTTIHDSSNSQTIYLYVWHLNNISRLRYVILRSKVISKGRGNEMFCCWYVVWYDFKVLNYTTIQPPHLSRKCTSVQTRPIPFSPPLHVKILDCAKFLLSIFNTFLSYVYMREEKYFHSKKYTAFCA